MSKKQRNTVEYFPHDADGDGMKECIRCGRSQQIEEHHIIELYKGGSDDPDNKEYRCQPCHKYEHAKRAILHSLERAKKWGQAEQAAFLGYRLEVLEKLNTVELIRERGTYMSYWTDKTTHHYPPYKPKGQAKKIEPQQDAQKFLPPMEMVSKNGLVGIETLLL